MVIKEDIEKRLLAGFGVAFAIAVIIVIAAATNTGRSTASSEWVNHTHAVILELDGILASLEHAEAIHRTYLMSGADADRSAYRVAAASVAEHLGVARALSEDSPQHKERIAKLETVVNRRLEMLDANLKTRLEKGYAAARAELAASLSLQLLTDIRKTTVEMKQEENLLLQQRDQQAHHDARWTRYILFSGLGLSFLLLAFLFVLIQADLRLRRQAAAIMTEYNARLEQKVAERTAELAQSNRSLEIENLERRWAAEGAERQYLHNELIIQCIDAGVYVITRNGNITQLNLTGGRLADYEPELLVGKSIETILPLTDAGKSWKESQLYRSITQDEALRNVRAIMRRKDGSALAVRFNSRAMRAEGKVVGAVVTVFADS